MLKLFLFCVLTMQSCSANPIGHKESDLNTNEVQIEKTESEKAISKLNLPSNASSIRADITYSGFSCENKSYGYYADIENECQIFHVCLPVKYADGKSSLFRWSFICPEETIFSQDSFTCMRSEDMLITCEESAKYFDLNGNFGLLAEEQSEIIANEKRKQGNISSEITNNQPINQVAPENLASSEINVKNTTHVKLHANLTSEMKKNNIEEQHQSSNLIEKNTSLSIKNNDPTSVNDIDKKGKIDSEELHDSSSEVDIVSALINSFTDDTEHSNNVEPHYKEQNSIDEKIQQIEENPLDAKQEDVLKTEILNNDHSTINEPSFVSIDDVIGLVKDSLDNTEVSNIAGTTERIKPIYQRNEDVINDNSKIIVITKAKEETGSLITESTDSKIIPLEIKEPTLENLDLSKTKSRRHLK